MSNLINDQLYDRMAELLPYLPPATCDELDELIKEGDLESAHFLLNVLEAKLADDLVDHTDTVR